MMLVLKTALLLARMFTKALEFDISCFSVVPVNEDISLNEQVGRHAAFKPKHVTTTPLDDALRAGHSVLLSAGSDGGHETEELI